METQQMEQIIEMLARFEKEMMARMDANHEEMLAEIKAERKANHEEMMAMIRVWRQTDTKDNGEE
jgi:ClpP class serine protease